MSDILCRALKSLNFYKKPPSTLAGKVLNAYWYPQVCFTDQWTGKHGFCLVWARLGIQFGFGEQFRFRWLS